jgi:hypothetical protein
VRITRLVSDIPLAALRPVLPSVAFTMPPLMSGYLQGLGRLGLRTSVSSANTRAQTGLTAGLDETDSGVCPESSRGAQAFRVEGRQHARLTRRGWLAGLGTLTWMAPDWATAGTFLPISLDELVTNSRHVVVGTPRGGDSVWEEIGGSRRIVTYTRLTLDEVLDDTAPQDSEVLLRTLGGQVGKLGQSVEGEATLRRDEVCVAFLAPRSDGTFQVAGLSQGHYPLRSDAAGTRRLVPGCSHAEHFAKDLASAVARLKDRSIPDARNLILGARRGK